MDDNNDKRLSFGEFRKGCRDFGVEDGENGTTDNDLRLLFNSFDKDGNGYLSYDELLVAIRGELSPLRSAWVKSAFQKLDRTGDGIATVEDLVGVYDTTGHPDVQSGKKTSLDVLRSILDQMDTKGEEDGLVTEGEFLSYYGGISASIDSDAQFVEMMKKSWRITDLKPPARTVRKSAQDRKVVHVNLADQTHGDVINWTNDSSKLEDEGARRRNQAGATNSRFHNKGIRGGANGLGHHDSTLKLFSMDSKFDGDAHLDGIPNEEWLAAGAVRMKRHPNHKAISSTANDILSWPGASGTKENKADVEAKLEAARLDEERRLFPKGPRLNSTMDGGTCFSGALGKAHALLGDKGMSSLALSPSLDKHTST
jgi:Ca2+-binding EF-hand superfamily protein